MKKDTHITEVIFRQYKDTKETLALFPYIVQTHNGDIECYQHTGQHGYGEYYTCIKLTTPSKPEEYADLKTELEKCFGYKLKVCKRRNFRKYRRAYEKAKKFYS